MLDPDNVLLRCEVNVLFQVQSKHDEMFAKYSGVQEELSEVQYEKQEGLNLIHSRLKMINLQGIIVILFVS